MGNEEKSIVSAAHLCRKFHISPNTLRNIVDEVGNEAIGRFKIRGMKHHRFDLLKAESVLKGKA